MNTCGHDDRKHYAKGMCNPCYHKFGRVKKPWKCEHDKLYAHGLCQACYIAHYNKKRLGRRYKSYRKSKKRNNKKPPAKNQQPADEDQMMMAEQPI